MSRWTWSGVLWRTAYEGLSARHQQVTDAYLLGLAIHRGGILATLDRKIGDLVEPGSDFGKALEILV